MSRTKPKDSFSITAEELATLTVEEHEELLKKVYELCKEAILRAFSENPDVVEVVVCDGQVVYMARELGEIDMGLLRDLMSRYGKPCYVFGRPKMVEEVPWSTLNGDWYPTVEFLMGPPGWDETTLRRPRLAA